MDLFKPPKWTFKRHLMRSALILLAVIVFWTIFFSLPDSHKKQLASTVVKPFCKPMNGAFHATPPDRLLGDVFSCIAADRADDAARVDFLATAYIHFDKRRLQDDLEWTYIGPVKVNGRSSMMSEEQHHRLDASKSALRSDPKAWQAFCDELNRIGPPTYYPDYLQFYRSKRGMAMRDPKLKIDFDVKQTWRDILTSKLSCKG